MDASSLEGGECLQEFPGDSDIFAKRLLNAYPKLVQVGEGFQQCL